MKKHGFISVILSSFLFVFTSESGSGNSSSIRYYYFYITTRNNIVYYSNIGGVNDNMFDKRVEAWASRIKNLLWCK